MFLCREAIDLIVDIEQELLDRNNLTVVLDELDWSLRNDDVAKLILNAPVEKFILKGDDIKLAELKIRLEVLERVLSPMNYVETCQWLLVNAIKTGKEKKLISNLSRTLVSMLINIGISKQYLETKTHELFFSGEELKSPDDVSNFFLTITPMHHSYEIYFIVSNLIYGVKDSINDFNIRIIDRLPDTTQEVANKSNLICEKGEVWVEVQGIEAFDTHSARMKAEAQLEMVRDFFLLFAHKNKILWRGETVITQCCDPVPIVIKKPKNAMEKCNDYRAIPASKHLNRLISRNQLQGNSLVKFHRAVDFHGVGLTNDISENQLINIWIALETIVPSHVHEGSKITKICKMAMPIFLKSYLLKLIKNLMFDLIRWDRRKISAMLRRMPNSKDISLLEKILMLVTLVEYQNLRDELFKELANYYLLRFRLHEIVELFKKPENLLQRISTHEKKVAWQIRRIYRTRNLIVHSGKSPSYINALIENAHDYLDQIINTIIRFSCGSFSATSLEQVFDVAQLNYETYISQLKELKNIDSKNIFSLI